MWTLLNESLTNPEAIVPLGGGSVLVAGDQSVVSRDEGRTTTVLDLPSATGATRSHVFTREGVFTSSDGWKTFQQTFKKKVDHACEVDAGAWIASGSAIHRFADGKWKKLSTGSRKRIGAIAHGHGALVISVGKQTIYRSTDLGDTWTQHTLDMRSSEWLTRIWVLDQGFVGVTNERPIGFWTSKDGVEWSPVDHSVPPAWTGAAAGDQLYLAGAGVTTVVEHMGLKIEEVQSPGEIRVLAYGPDGMDDDRLWAASRTHLWVARG